MSEFFHADRSIWAKRGVAAVALAGVGLLSACGNSKPINPDHYRQAAVTLHKGNTPNAVEQCVEGALAPLGSAAANQIIGIMTANGFDALQQVTLPMLNAPVGEGQNGTQMETVAVNCPPPVQANALGQ